MWRPVSLEKNENLSCWERLKAEGEGDGRGWDGWMASPTRCAWIWVNSGSCDGQGGLAWCDSWGCKELDTTEWLNWTELIHTISVHLIEFSQTEHIHVTSTQIKNKHIRSPLMPPSRHYPLLLPSFFNRMMKPSISEQIIYIPTIT